MPGWHASAQPFVRDGRLQIAGIVEEQHPDRARLFMQWHQMDWPIMVDSLNLLGVSAVPITLFIDEHGIVRRINPKPAELASFVDRNYDPPDPPLPHVTITRPAIELTPPSRSVQGWRAFAENLVLWSGPEQLDRAIDAYAEALALAPRDGPLHFRLGVVYRARHDSSQARPGDFAKAADHWGRALALDPNQYIWRRRIQQYGPRLDKPYSFYDWVYEARREITARGEKPLPLSVEPGGAELAYPSATFQPGNEDHPDPKDRIERDPGRWIRIEIATVPATAQPGKPVRVHLMLRPDSSANAHWNNEGEPTMLWVDLPPGWQADHRRLTIPNPPEAVSRESRMLEFEVRPPRDAAPGGFELHLFVLYGVCESENGTCLYRRQDVTVPILLQQE